MSAELVPDLTADPTTVDLSAHEFEIPCDYSGHAGDDASDWFVVKAPNCEHDAGSQFYCDPCWTYRNHTGSVQCRRCERNFPAMNNVVRIERIR